LLHILVWAYLEDNQHHIVCLKAHYEHSDICVVPAAGVIAKAVLATVLADACLEKFGGDNLKETLANYRNYLSNIS